MSRKHVALVCRLSAPLLPSVHLPCPLAPAAARGSRRDIGGCVMCCMGERVTRVRGDWPWSWPWMGDWERMGKGNWEEDSLCEWEGRVGSNACTRRRIGTIVCSIAWSWLCCCVCRPQPPRAPLVVNRVECGVGTEFAYTWLIPALLCLDGVMLLYCTLCWSDRRGWLLSPPSWVYRSRRCLHTRPRPSTLTLTLPLIEKS